MNIAITGATGFIGRHLVNYFSEKGYHVLAIGRNLTRLNNCFTNEISKYQSDYSLESLVKGFRGMDVVVHLAAKRLTRDTNPYRLNPFFESNILPVENIFLAAKELNIKKVCQTSSISVYSEANQIPFRENVLPQAANIYGISKLASEHIGNLFSAKTHVKATNLRLGYLYGQGEKKDLVFMKFIYLAKNKLTLPIWGTGKTRVDYIYVKDVVSAIDKAIQPEAPHGTYNISSGKSYSVLEIAKVINEVFQNEDNIIFITTKQEKGGDIFMDITKAKQILNWKPELNLKEALIDLKKLENGK